MLGDPPSTHRTGELRGTLLVCTLIPPQGGGFWSRVMTVCRDLDYGGRAAAMNTCGFLLWV